MSLATLSAAEELARDVREGLARRQKQLPSQYLYDDLGSALFDAITLLPEYGLTRADERIVRQHAADIEKLISPDLVAELGSGSGRKTRPILEAVSARRYHPIDISSAALERCVAELRTVPGVRVEPVEATYLDGLERVRATRPANSRLLLLFLGSTIGNFDPDEAVSFLRKVRQRLRPGDALLLGTDLVKPPDVVIPAYDDALGVTAAFNKNLLQRLNRELGGNFDPAAFRHVARYDRTAKRIEMHLESEKDQCVYFSHLSWRVHFRAGETIWTEASYKFTTEDIEILAEAAGFECVEQWIDPEWAFAETLLVVED